MTGPGPVTLTIEDDDETPTVALALSRSSISENGGTATVTARLDRASSAPTVVTVTASPDASGGCGRLPAERRAYPDRSGGQEDEHRDGDDRGRR